ncbi:MAG: PAS domain-containing protein, partial [Candidatus Eiseniibacteriota bacterium]
IPSDIPLSAKDRPRPDHPEDRAALDARWREHMKTGEPFDSEFRLRRADGVYRWVFSRRVPLRDENGEVIKWYAAAYDIDDQKQAMAALRHSEAELAKAQRELQLIVDTIPAMVTTYRADSTLEFINKTWRDYTGFTPDEYTHERWQLVIHPDDFPVVDRAWTEHLASKTPFQNELRVRRADGSYRWVLTSRVPLLDEDGEVIRWYGASYDIDEQKQALAALRRSEAYLDEAQRLSQTGSFGWNLADGTIVWSKEAYRILDFDERVTPTLDMVLERAHPDDIHIVRDHIDRARRGGQSYDYEHRLLRTDGSVRQIHVRSRLIDYGPGEQEMVGALMDVTAAREAEAALHAAQTQLAHATRMTTLGEMSASIAHEVNQPLAAITTDGQAGLRWLERKTPNVDEATQAMRRVVAEAGRASAVMSRIRSLAKKADLEMAPLDINEVIDEAVMLVRREAQSHHVTLRFELAPALPAVLGDRIQLQQVLINLMINGVQAMATVSDRARDLCVCSGRLDTDQVLVAVRDAGVGVAPENLPRLFAAFYTTKRDGMGMGLSICRSIVEAHGGRVWTAPNDGGGMTFHFTVAAYAPAA